MNEPPLGRDGPCSVSGIPASYPTGRITRELSRSQHLGYKPIVPPKSYWLFKSEPDCYSIEDLLDEPSGAGRWDGVRNYQARNYMRDLMSVGDGVLFYHSSCPEPGIAGIAKVSSQAYPDDTQFDPASEGYDSKSNRDEPRWWLVEIAPVKKLETPLSLAQMKQMPELASMVVLRRGNRLSITPVTKKEWDAIIEIVR